MKKIIGSIFLLLSIQAFAEEKKTPDIVISNLVVMMPIQGTNVTAAFGLIENRSNRAASVKFLELSPFKAVEMHETVEIQGKMGMRKIDEFLLPPHQNLELKPGSHHIMLFDPSRSIKVGEKLEGKFSIGGKTVSARFVVKERNK